MPIGWTTHSAFRARLQVAGMSLSNTNLPVVSPRWDQFQYVVPPDAQLITDSGETWIEWATDWQDFDLPLSPVPGRCLWDFQWLASATDESILSFAIDWGPLDEAVPESLEALKEPSYGRIRRLPTSVLEELQRIAKAGGGRVSQRWEELMAELPAYKHWNSLELWRATARELKAILTVAASLQQQ